MTQETFYTLLREARAARKWPAHLTFTQIVEQWQYQKETGR
mgnify:CR=1 FL=1